MKIAVACGGTGGHIFPGLATARVLRDRGHSVTLWLSGRSIEKTSIADWDGEINTVKACGFPSKISLSFIPIAWTLFCSLLKCRSQMRKSKPDVILAMGSYASVGPVLAARSLSVPVVLHEANAVPGRAIVFLSKCASAVGISFEDAASSFRGMNVELTGFPVRSEIKPPDESIDHSKLRVLVMGGSQGAHRINEIAVDAFKLLSDRGTAFEVTHLTGKDDAEMARSAYKESGVNADVYEFLESMNSAYASADIAVCRSGAATCAELAVAGVPVLLIPLPSSMYGHQMANARSMQKCGAADIIEQKDLSPSVMADYLYDFLKNADKREKMKANILRLASPDATDKLADLVEKTAATKSQK